MATFRGIKVKRGVIKAFREYLNATHPRATYRNDAYHQATRPYGDYLYSQDRAMFEADLYETLCGDLCPDFDRNAWIIK